MPAATSVATPSAIPSPADLKAAMASDSNSKIDVSSLFVADKAASDAAAASLIGIAQNEGPAAVHASGFAQAAIKALQDKKSPAVRESAPNAVKTIVDKGAIKSLEPVFVSSGLYAALLETFADKMPAVRTAAVDAVKAYVAAMNPWATTTVMPELLKQIKSAGKWQIKTGALAVLDQLVSSAPQQTARLMPDIVPVLSEAIWDTKADVKKAARETLTKACNLVSNKDIERFIPTLISVLINPVGTVQKGVERGG